MSGKLLTTQEVAVCLGVNAERVRYLVSTGQIKAVRITPRLIRFDQHDVELYRTSAAPLMPAAPLAYPARMGTVYFVSSGEFVKIGFTTKSMQERIKYLQTGNPHKLEQLHTILNVECSFEKVLHRLLSGARHREEWFKTDQDLLHPCGNRIATPRTFVKSFAANEFAALEEWSIPWGRGP